MSDAFDRCRPFRELHESGCFVIPNPWDLGSARTLVQLGFKALATTSSGFAWSMGRADNAESLDEALAHIRSITQGVDIPVNADFEGGFATEPDAVRSNVTAATATVRRISVGGALDRAACTGFLQAATEIADLGTFRNLGRAVSFAEVNARFTSR